MEIYDINLLKCKYEELIFLIYGKNSKQLVLHAHGELKEKFLFFSCLMIENDNSFTYTK